MAQGILDLIHDFNVILQEDNAGFPCRGKLKKIGEDLVCFGESISSKLPDGGQIEEAEKLLHDLLGILKECREHKNDICAGNFKALTALPRLQKLTRKLEKIKATTTSEAADNGAVGEGKSGEDTMETYEWTSSFIETDKIYYMEEQVKEIVDDLIETKSFAAVGIVGMMGSGKTALAQKVFLDERVMDKFALRLWVCVSPHKCRPKEVLMRMLDNLGLDLDEVEKILGDNCGTGKLEEVGVLLFILYMVLLDKSYLIVFDDVWCEETQPGFPWYRNLALTAPWDREWTHRLAYGLPKDDLGGGSAVVVTSRREDVARAMVGSGGVVHRTKPLQDELLEVGWTVFKEAFKEAGGEETMVDGWKEMKRFIVEKCNGLPLALKVAGRELARPKSPTKSSDVASATVVSPPSNDPEMEDKN